MEMLTWIFGIALGCLSIVGVILLIALIVERLKESDLI
jgi:hypothetical protein